MNILGLSALLCTVMIFLYLRRRPQRPPSRPSEAVVLLAREGRTIEAIKLHRQLTGDGLRQAKDAVDAIPPRG